jgi:hypothetical protein
MDNANKILESLNAAEIRRRLSEMNAEQDALRVLLRAATRLERQRVTESGGKPSSPLLRGRQ